MGFVATPTPSMKGWSVEVRSESFYLQPPGPDRLFAYGDARRPSMLELCLEDVPALRAALDQAERVHALGARFEWASRDEDRLVPVDAVRPVREVSVEGVLSAECLLRLARAGSAAVTSPLRTGVECVLADPARVPRTVAEEFVAAAADASDEDVAALREAFASALVVAEEEYTSRLSALELV